MTLQRYVLGDWGTSRLRLFLLENGTVVDTCEGPGIGRLAAASDDARLETLAGLVAPWIDETQTMQVLLGGMAGSRNGLFEVPYAALPADSAVWSRAARTTVTARMRITIAAGLKSSSQDVADVMRGEETQIFGAMQLDPALRRGTHVILLPGTHSKWAEIADGSIVRFRTAMTGELYALLRDSSTLLRTDAAGEDAGAANHAQREAGFSSGVARSFDRRVGLTTALFEARAAQLIEHRSRSWAAGFLSGLLIGHEILAMSESFQSAGPVRLVGDPGLVSLYQAVLDQRLIEARALGGAQCAIAGLTCLHENLAER